MTVYLKTTKPIVVTLPDKSLNNTENAFRADNEALDNKDSSNEIDIMLDTADTIDSHRVTLEEEITCGTTTGAQPPNGLDKKVGIEIASRPVPRARQVTYGGETYTSLTKCLKALGLCRDRFKYLKRTRPELRTDNAIIGLLIHERRKHVQQANHYVVAIKGTVEFLDNLTAACTRVNQITGVDPKQALTQGKVSKYRYEHNRRPKNKDRPITLHEAFTACLTRMLIKLDLLEAADKAMFKARMDVVSKDLNDEADLFDVVGEDDSHIEALKDLTEQYHDLHTDK